MGLSRVAGLGTVSESPRRRVWRPSLSPGSPVHKPASSWLTLPEWPCHCSYLTAVYWDSPRCFPEWALCTHFTHRKVKKLPKASTVVNRDDPSPGPLTPEPRLLPLPLRFLCCLPAPVQGGGLQREEGEPAGLGREEAGRAGDAGRGSGRRQPPQPSDARTVHTYTHFTLPLAGIQAQK